MSGLLNGINAWIYLNEDEPPGTNYDSANSCYQSLVQYRIYDGLDFLGIAFFDVLPTANGSTIGVSSTASHPGGLSNQDYLNNLIRDARQINPNIKLLATMVYSGDHTLASIFAGGGDAQTQATAFANNLVAYLKSAGMNGMDIDWEPPLSNDLTQSQFQTLFTTIRNVFDQQPVKYYLSMAPAWPWDVSALAGTINSTFDFVSPQFYDGTSLQEFLDAGIAPDRMGYGAQFEPGNAAPNASAQQVWDAVSPGFTDNNVHYGYQDVFVWRLNSGNFQFEQAQIAILGQLANPPAGSSFDDSPIVGAAGNPSMTQMTIRSGDVLNAIQAVNTGTGAYNTGTQNTGTGVFTLPQHGGNSGAGHTFDIPLDDPIVSMSGYTGWWYGWQCVLQLTLQSKSGKTYGPFGTMAGATTRTAFTQTAPSGQSLVAFSGGTVTVPLAGGSRTQIIANLTAHFA